MNADCAFWIGRTHPVCQDYALAASGSAEAHVILVDGCSSSPDSDIGARLLAKSAERFLASQTPDRTDWEAYPVAAVRHAADCAGRLGLKATCLDATLLTIRSAQGAFTAICCGDGIVALGRRDGSVEIYAIWFEANAPYYPGYLADGGRRRLWESQPGNAKSVERWIVDREGVTEAEIVPPQGPLEVFTGDCAEYRFAAVLSDGVQSFTRMEPMETSKSMSPLAAADVLVPLLAFKGAQGLFVQRRARAFRKECLARGWHHADDVSLAVIWLGE